MVSQLKNDFLPLVVQKMIPYFQKKHNINIFSNLSLNYDKITKFRENLIKSSSYYVDRKIKTLEDVNIGYGEFVKDIFSSYSHLFKVNPNDSLISNKMLYLLRECIPESYIETHFVESKFDEYPIVRETELKIKHLSYEETKNLNSLIPKEVLKDATFQNMLKDYKNKIYESKKLDFKNLNILPYSVNGVPSIFKSLGNNFVGSVGPDFREDLKYLYENFDSAAYLYFFVQQIEINSNHSELVLFLKDDEPKFCIPIFWKVSTYTNLLDFYIVMSTEWNPIATSGEGDCTIIELLYARTLLKDDCKLLKKCIFFEVYLDNQIKRYFIPHPKVLRYSHSTRYNKYIMCLVDNGEFEHKGEKEKHESIREMLTKSMNNLIKQSSYELKEILKDNIDLLSRLPSINQEFQNHYVNHVLPYREKHKFSHNGLDFYDPIKHTKMKFPNK
uniref:Uncharacterized protein n=1 Tax=viral metagenome TaxID=1070528 RepID=A0A6C0JV85_9ZZZZ